MQSKTEFYNYLVKLSDAYYNSDEPLVTDAEFDHLCEQYENEFKESFTYLGSAPTHAKVKLPYFTSSLTKVKDIYALARFEDSQPKTTDYIMTEKLDGVSLVVHYKDSSIQLYTRGDGTFGKNVSHLLPHINSIPRKVKKDELLVRGELVIPKQKASSYGEQLRNIVSGVVTAKIPNLQILKDVHFVAHGIQNLPLKPSEAFEYLRRYNFKLPMILDRTVATIQNCNATLTVFQQDSKYQIDGLVIAKDIYIPITDDKPKHIVAFKRMGDTQDTEVVKVSWDAGRYGTLHPVVVIKPVTLDGCTITNCSGFNAKYIFDNSIGPGSIVKVQRSGGVIPDIVSVEQPSAQPQMPDMPFTWDGVHIRTQGKTVDQEIARLVFSMKLLDAKGVSEGIIRKLYAAGFTDECKLFAATQSDLMRAESVKEKSAENIFKALQTAKSNLTVLNCLKLSAVFNNFSEKLAKIMNEIDVVEYIKTKHIPTAMLTNILCSISIVTQAQVFIDGCETFRKDKLFMTLLDMATKTQQKEKPKVEISARVVFTGFRDKELSAKCAERGIEVIDNMTKTTSMLVVLDKEVSSTKTEKAKKDGIPILTKEDFIERYIK